MRNVIRLCLIFALWACHPKPPRVQTQELVTGDLIYLNLNCKDLCSAIEDVTKTQFQVDGPDLSHVGVLTHEQGQWFVYEAWGQVKKTSLSEFLLRVTRPSQVLVQKLPARLAARTDDLIKALESRVGLPYDDHFEMNNGKYYCSELVYDAFEEAFGEDNPLVLRPMFYGSASLNPKSYGVWKAYFSELGVAIPQGQPGISPLGIYTMLAGHISGVNSQQLR